MSEGITISTDRVIGFVVIALVGFNTFRNETKNSEKDVSVELTRIAANYEAFGDDLDDLKDEMRAFTSKPRFAPDDFATGVAPIDQRLTRIEGLAARRGDTLDDLRESDLQVQAEVQALEVRLSLLEGAD